MPYKWVEPEFFVEVDGVAVYHCYDDVGVRSWYWYTTDVHDDNTVWTKSDTAQFDVRDLSDLGLDAHDFDTHARIIEQAIQAGLVSGEPAVREPLPVVKIEVIGGVAHVLDKPPGIEVEIIDRDGAGEKDEAQWPD